MIIKNNKKERVDELVTLRIRKADQPEFYEVLRGSSHSGFPKVDWVKTVEGDTVVIRVNYNAFGNERFTVEMTGWEMATLVEMSCPREENPIQLQLGEQFKNAAGRPLIRLFCHLSEQLRKYGPKDCVRHVQTGELLTGVIKETGCFYDARQEVTNEL